MICDSVDLSKKLSSWEILPFQMYLSIGWCVTWKVVENFNKPGFAKNSVLLFPVLTKVNLKPIKDHNKFYNLIF